MKNKRDRNKKTKASSTDLKVKCNFNSFGESDLKVHCAVLPGTEILFQRVSSFIQNES